METLAAGDVGNSELAALSRVLEKQPQGPLRDLVSKIVAACQSGQDVFLALAEEELSPEGAAAFLGVSRPMVYKLMDDGSIPFRCVGRHRRIPLSTVATLHEQRRSGRKRLAEVFGNVGEARRAYLRDRAQVDAATAERLGY
jgi:excisionase family DNA binding protein